MEPKNSSLVRRSLSTGWFYFQGLSTVLSVVTFGWLLSIFAFAGNSFVKMAGGYTEAEWQEREAATRPRYSYSLDTSSSLSLEECEEAMIKAVESGDLDVEHWSSNASSTDHFGLYWKVLEDRGELDGNNLFENEKVLLDGNAACWATSWEGDVGYTQWIIIASSVGDDADPSQYREAVKNRFLRYVPDDYVGFVSNPFASFYQHQGHTVLRPTDEFEGLQVTEFWFQSRPWKADEIENCLKSISNTFVNRNQMAWQDNIREFQEASQRALEERDPASGVVPRIEPLLENGLIDLGEDRVCSIW